MGNWKINKKEYTTLYKKCSHINYRVEQRWIDELDAKFGNIDNKTSTS
jgi:hypothetical protein